MAKKKIQYKERPDEELKQIAKDIHGNLIFTDRHIHPDSRKSMIASVFMPLFFLDKKSAEEMKRRKIAVIYEYYSKAGRMSINGYPIFSSFGALTEGEWKKVSEYLAKIDAAMKLV